jgi:hypothetical protein
MSVAECCSIQSVLQLGSFAFDNVFGCALWMAMEYDGFRFIQSPQRPQRPISPANRAVAFDEVLGLLSDADPDSAAVA